MNDKEYSEWDARVKQWDRRNSKKPVSKWEPFPENMTHIVYPNGFYVITKEYIDEIKRELKKEMEAKE